MGTTVWKVVDKASATLNRIGLSWLFVLIAQQRVDMSAISLEQAQFRLDLALRRVTESARRWGSAMGGASVIQERIAEFSPFVEKTQLEQGRLFLESARAVKNFGEGSLQASLAIAQLEDFEEDNIFTLGRLGDAIAGNQDALNNMATATRSLANAQERFNSSIDQLNLSNWLFFVGSILQLASAAPMAASGIRALAAANMMMGAGVPASMALRSAGAVAPFVPAGAAAGAGASALITAGYGAVVLVSILETLKAIEANTKAGNLDPGTRAFTQQGQWWGRTLDPTTGRYVRGPLIEETM